MTALRIVPVFLNQARDVISRLHRHELAGKQRPLNGGRWAHGVVDDNRGDTLCGVAVVGQPVARMLDDGFTVEVRRVATDGTPNACSILYRAASRTAREMGYLDLVTYIHTSELGTSLRAAGWVLDPAVTKGRQWTHHARPGQITLVEDRMRWWAPWSRRAKAIVEAEGAAREALRAPRAIRRAPALSGGDIE